MRHYAHACLTSYAGVRFSRRQWMQLLAVEAALVTRQAHTAALERVFSLPPRLVSPIQGAVDFRVHFAPNVFGQSVDDDETAELTIRKQMGALVLKNHVFATASHAYFLRKRFPGRQVFGGIVLNGSICGVNPQAMQWTRRMQGRCGKVVRLPTIDAD